MREIIAKTAQEFVDGSFAELIDDGSVHDIFNDVVPRLLSGSMTQAQALQYSRELTGGYNVDIGVMATFDAYLELAVMRIRANND